jgi:protein-tyrosine phosphatase
MIHTPGVKICFVCLGNICRSPTAEAVMAAQIDAADLQGQIEVDSAGTGGWHRGAPPDERSAAEARRHGVELTSRARQVHAGDFAYFDLLVAMDRTNRDDLLDLAPTVADRAKVHLLREFDLDTDTDTDPDTDTGPTDPDRPDRDVPDPYLGGPDGFAEVYDLIESACAGLLVHLRAGSG